MSDIADIPTEILDVDGHVHRLQPSSLGYGGQGIVFRTGDPNTALKILTGAGGGWVRDPEARQQLIAKLEDVRVLPLPKLRLALPQALLAQPYAGYTMRLLNGMVPIRKLIPACPPNLAEFYLGTGGLRRRLRILTGLAETLVRLHAVPVVYADLSSNNVFVPVAADSDEVWLIDADNLQILSAPGRGIYTPLFGAPELVRGTAGVSTLTDVHAFAVLAFYVLALQHPLLGDHVSESGGWESNEDLEARALAGELPWIHDTTDASNHSSKGIPREIVLSPRLWGLFDRCFGAGRTDPLARPSMSEWAEVLGQASALTVRCPACSGTYYFRSARCPWCEDPRPAFLYIQARVWDPDLDEGELDLTCRRRALGQDAMQMSALTVGHQVITVGEEAAVPRWLTRAAQMGEQVEESLRLRFGLRCILLDVLDSGEYHWVPPTADRCAPISKSRECPLPTASAAIGHVHCGKLNEVHRLLSISFIAGGHDGR